MKANPPNNSRAYTSPDILSERLHPISKNIQFYKKTVSRRDICRYMECIFQSAELGVENILITMVLGFIS
jgi:hypothetical protein